MTSKTKKVILDAKLRGQVNLTLPLLLNQLKRIQTRAEVILMRINKWTRGGTTCKVASELICKDIGCLMPEREILNHNAKFIHKQITTQPNPALQKFIAIPNRCTSKLYHKVPKKKLYRTSFEYLLQLYNQIPPELKPLKPQTFSKRPKKYELEFTPED